MTTMDIIGLEAYASARVAEDRAGERDSSMATLKRHHGLVTAAREAVAAGLKAFAEAVAIAENERPF